MGSGNVLVSARLDVMLLDGGDRSEILESMVAKQLVTLCGTINTASPGNVGRTQRAYESYLSDAFSVCSIEV